jgi:plasmid stabilization system protein ParE
MGEYRLHPEAELELNDAFSYYLEQSPQAAERFMREAIAAFHKAADNPTR